MADFGKEIDRLISKRDLSEVKLTQAKMELLDMGVKTIENGQLYHMPGLDVETFYDWNNQEFSWEAEYKDGKVIKQFEDDGKDRHYGHIEQDRLAKFRWVSCFDWATDQEDKQVVVELDFENGDFNFQNGSVNQDVRTAIFEFNQAYQKLEGDIEKTLTMKRIHRESTTTKFPEGEDTRVSIYNRYIIGMKAGDLEIVLCIEPNGTISVWDK